MFLQSAKKILKFIFPRCMLVPLKCAYILARYYGAYFSLKHSACLDNKKQYIPWYTYPCIEYIDNLNLKNLKIFEYGCGFSSSYFLKKGCSVYSVEDSPVWFNRFNKKNIKHTVKLKKGLDYVQDENVLKSDIIIIDGNLRKQCGEHIFQNISKKEINPYMIIFDNSDWFPSTISLLDKLSNFIRVDFCGFGPLNSFTWTTSVFINKRKTLTRIGPIVSKRGTGEIFD